MVSKLYIIREYRIILFFLIRSKIRHCKRRKNLKVPRQSPPLFHVFLNTWNFLTFPKIENLFSRCLLSFLCCLAWITWKYHSGWSHLYNFQFFLVSKASKDDVASKQLRKVKKISLVSRNMCFVISRKCFASILTILSWSYV